MFKKLFKKLIKNYSKVPLFWVQFDLNKYLQNGAKNSCLVEIHPELVDDKYVKNTLNGLIEYIRNNYDMKKISK